MGLFNGDDPRNLHILSTLGRTYERLNHYEKAFETYKQALALAQQHKEEDVRAELLSSIMYLSVVSRNSLCITLKVAALNGLKILACDIQNMYLLAPCCKKVYCIAGADFGSEVGLMSANNSLS